MPELYDDWIGSLQHSILSIILCTPISGHYGHTVSPERNNTLLLRRVLKTEEGQMKSRGCTKPTIELVQTGPNLILKFKEMEWFGPTQWWVWRTLYFSSSPPQFWVLGNPASVYFLLVETVCPYEWTIPTKQPVSLWGTGEGVGLFLHVGN